MRIYNIDEVCTALSLKAPVLRKYSALLEDAGYTGIGRNSNNTRYYTDDNIRLLREMIDHKQSGHMTLADAAKAIAARENGIDVMPDDAQAMTPHDDIKKLTDAFLALTAHLEDSEQRHTAQLSAVLDELKEVKAELADLKAEVKAEQALLIEARQAEDIAEEVVNSDETQTKSGRGLFRKLFRRP